LRIVDLHRVFGNLDDAPADRFGSAIRHDPSMARVGADVVFGGVALSITFTNGSA
jgi:hypothetical protein